jgi:hypothetical protein
MNDIYPLWVSAHGIMIVTPVSRVGVRFLARPSSIRCFRFVFA